MGIVMKPFGVLASLGMLVLLGACSVTPEALSVSELTTQTAADRIKMFDAMEPLDHPLTFDEALARAVKYNLDVRTKRMEQALALGQTKVDSWTVLPQLAANAGYTDRSRPYATNSRDLVTGVVSSGNPTYSSDTNVVVGDLSLTWNILDFGLSYYEAKENADRVLIARERQRKTLQNLLQEVRYAYWRAAAAQVLEGRVRSAVASADRALAAARRVETDGEKNPADALRYEKALLDNLRQLEAIADSLATAHIELNALINQPPEARLVLAPSGISSLSLPKVGFSVAQMEEVAMLNNPDLHEQAYNARIAAEETRKAYVRMLPGLSFSTGPSFDTNSLLADNQWYAAGARASWNLFNFLSAPARIENAKGQEQLAEARRLALRMAVLAQVQVGWRQYLGASNQFRRANQSFHVEQQLARLTTARADNDAQSTLDRIAGQTSAIAADLRRFQTYSEAQSALGKLYAAMGIDMLPGVSSDQDVDTLAREVRAGLENVQKGVLPSPPIAETAEGLKTAALAPAKGGATQ